MSRGSKGCRSLFGEPLRVLELEVAVDLVRGDVVVANTGGTRGLKQRERPDKIRLDERCRPAEGVVIMRLSRLWTTASCEANSEPTSSASQMSPRTNSNRSGGVLQERRDSGIGELVEHSDRLVGVAEDVVNEIRSDEPCAAGDQELFHLPEFTCCEVADRARAPSRVCAGSGHARQWLNARNHPGRRDRLPALHPITLGISKQLVPVYDNADDLLPAVHADAGGYPRHPHHHDAAGRGSVPTAPRGRFAFWSLPLVHGATVA